MRRKGLLISVIILSCYIFSGCGADAKTDTEPQVQTETETRR